MKKKPDVEAVSIPSGEGERRAMRGYVPQYEFAAHLIYEALASGQLRWVGLADRGAGSFDDVVLGLQDRVVGYQIKTRTNPEAFGLQTLLFGAEKLALKLYASWKKLKSGGQETCIQVAYVTKDFPRLNDRLGSHEGEELSSAAFLRTHGKNGADWSAREWLGSSFSGFIRALIDELSITEDEFTEFWQNVLFWTNDSGKQLGFRPSTSYEDRRVAAVSSILPRLVADVSDKDRWSAEELLKQLRWDDPFGQRHEHVFPLDLLIQSNQATEDEIEKAFSQVSRGYISLVGPPGSGKSTLLQAGLLPIPSAVFVRYLAFVPDEGHGLGRAEAFDFLHDLVGQLKRQGIGAKIIPASELPELRLQLSELLRQASERFADKRLRTVIVVDGLDHIPREERPERSLLQELPLPHAIPDGVIFMLGTQRLDLDGLPPAVRDQAAQEGRKIQISALRREVVFRLVDSAGVSPDVSRTAIFEKSEGHPLSVRYLVEGLLRQATENERSEWLANGPAYGGDISAFYESAWRGLDPNPDARRIFSYLALAEGAIDPARLDELVDRRSTDIAWRECFHLLRVDRRGHWSIFHNSFRLFLLEKTTVRFGQKDTQSLKGRYADLARLASAAPSDDPQRWMELRYHAKAEDDDSVIRIATSQRFRDEFIKGRNPSDIYADIRLAFSSVRKLRDATKLFELLLSKHEIEMRSDAIGVEELVKAYIAAGRIDVALGLVCADGVSLPITAPYLVIDALLQENRNDEARHLFEDIEPIDKLLGSETVDLWGRDGELYSWAAYVLTFREPRHFLACLDRLREPVRQFAEENSLDDFRNELKLIAARSEFEANPDEDVDEVCKRLHLDTEWSDTLSLTAAEVAYACERPDVARMRFLAAAKSVQEFDDESRINATRILLSIDDVQLAAVYMNGVPAPTLIERPGGSTMWLASASRKIIAFTACEVQLNRTLSHREYPESSLLSAFQHRLEAIGKLIGRGRAGKKETPESIWQEVSQTIALLQLGGFGGEEQAFNWERYELNQAMPAVASAIVTMCGVYGKDALSLVSRNVDKILAEDPGMLGSSRFRRAYASAMFSHERSPDLVVSRLAIIGEIGGQQTPQEYVEEVAETARALALCGAPELAFQQLDAMHEGALGISRPAKKDAQYVMWRDIFQRSCSEVPEAKESQLLFFSRLLDGLSNTEGSGSASRLAPMLLAEAADCRAQLCIALANRLQEAGLLNWPTLVGATLKGLAKKRNDLAHVCVVVFGRIALPFSDGYDEEIYSDLLSRVQTDRRCAAFANASDHIQVDAQKDVRIAYLNQVDLAARLLGTPRPEEAIKRWNEEVDTQAKRSSEDPYADIASLANLTEALRDYGDDKKAYFAIKAFERIAPHSEYAEILAFMSVPGIEKNERAIVIAARAAVASGQIEDAKNYANYLSTVAEESGSWGEWQSGTKLRLYQILIEIEGEEAKRKAFDSFARDMARGGEWSSSLMPDLASVFDLISPRPSWTEMWNALADHLSLFRDYRLGRELQAANAERTDEELVAELLFQAIALSSSELIQQVISSARDIAGCDRGDAVIIALLNRLKSAGGNHSLEAAHIAWELRRVPAVRAWASTAMEAWSLDDDLAIIRYAMLFAVELKKKFKLASRELPGIYRLLLPPSQEVEAYNFDPPTGFSESSSGIWMEDPFSLTWPLKRPLNILEKATDFELPAMRLRAAELMRQSSGVEALGPQSISDQSKTYRRLELHILYRRSPVLAAFRAVRRVAGELASAQELDRRFVPLLLSKAGAPDPVISGFVPMPRPAMIHQSRIPSAYETGELRTWLTEEVSSSPHRKTDRGIHVIAAAGSFERLSMRRDAVEEHLLMFSDVEPDVEDLDEALSALPRLILCDGLMPLYKGAADGGIVSIDTDMAGLVPHRAITLCPVLAERIGLSPLGPNLMSFRGSSGQVEVQTIWWRDGGISRRSTDGVLRGEGFIVTASDDAVARLRPYLGNNLKSHCWRSSKSKDSPKDNGSHYSFTDC